MPKSIRVVHRRVGISNPQQPSHCRRSAPPTARRAVAATAAQCSAAAFKQSLGCLGQVLPNYLEMKANAHLTVWRRAVK